MALQVTKDSVDLGIIVRDLETSLRFYRDTLGFAEVAQIPMPNGTMRMLMCGTSAIKILKIEPQPADTLPGGIQGATGYRYWTISIRDIEGAVAEIAGAGYAIEVGVTELRPGVKIAIVVDPDGNWVELLEMG